MVKAFTFVQTLITQTHQLIKHLSSTIHSIFTLNKSKNIPIIIHKKKKSIAKKEIRSYIRRKIIKNLKKGKSREQSLHALDIKWAEETSQNNKQYNQKCANISNSKANFIQFVKNNENDFICSVCRSPILLPAITQCDHIFCLECIQNTLNIFNKCPLCRATIANEQNYGLRIIKSVEAIIKMYADLYFRKEWPSDEENTNRLKEHEDWKKNRLVDFQQIKEGQKVDLWKSDSREWRKGQIITIYKDQHNTALTSFLVGFQHQSKEHNQIIQLPSLRIAKLNFYSNKQENDQFMFPDLQFRNSVRIAPQFQFSFPTFRRRLQQQQLTVPDNPFSNRHRDILTRRMAVSNALVPFSPPPAFTRLFRNLSNQQQTQSGTNRLRFLNPSEPQSMRFEPSESDSEIQLTDMLPILNPTSMVSNQAQEGSSQEGRDLPSEYEF